MAILIDGYNLLHASGILAGPGSGARTLERARRALLHFLLNTLTPLEIERTTIVFDARHPPTGFPRVVNYGGITVHFAAGTGDADETLEQLIRLDTSPRQLIVVSSDRRVQRAARRRRAQVANSDQWFASLRRRPREQDRNIDKYLDSPPEPDIDAWVHLFANDLREPVDGPSDSATSATSVVEETPSMPRDSTSEAGPLPPTVTPPLPTEPLCDPFPPHYAADIAQEFAEDQQKHQRRGKRK